MHFCTQCGNMYYLRLKTEGSDQLIYYCRNCGHTDDSLQETNLYVSKKESQGRVVAFAKELEEDGHKNEIARMLSGTKITSHSIEQAKEMIANG